MEDPKKLRLERWIIWMAVLSLVGLFTVVWDYLYIIGKVDRPLGMIALEDWLYIMRRLGIRPWPW